MSCKSTKQLSDGKIDNDAHVNSNESYDFIDSLIHVATLLFVVGVLTLTVRFLFASFPLTH